VQGTCERFAIANSNFRNGTQFERAKAKSNIYFSPGIAEVVHSSSATGISSTTQGD
jgi:hypothetical protein